MYPPSAVQWILYRTVNLETSKSVEQSTNGGAWKRAKEIKRAKHPVYQAAKELVMGSIQRVLR